MKSTSIFHPALLLAFLFLAGCASPHAPPPPVRMPPPAPETDAPENAAPVPPENPFPGILFLLNGQETTLADLSVETLDRNQTVLLRVESSVPYSVVTAALVHIHELGYLVGIAETSPEAP